MQNTIYGMDLAKRVMQLHWVDWETGEIHRKQVRRGKLLEFFVNREPGIIAMEACGSAHYWARELRKLGHEVRLIAAQFVRPFVKTNKTDAADAAAIWETVQRPDMRFVTVKSEEQQSVLALHRMREQLVKIRTMQVNEIRGLLYEFGIDLPQGREKGLKEFPEALATLEGRLSDLALETFRRQRKRLEEFDKDIADIEKRLTLWKKNQEAVARLMAIPGVGLLTATAIVATVGDMKSFRSGREFASFLGLVPRQSGTGGKVRLLGISKRGDTYLRTLLAHGARAVVNCQTRNRNPWIDELRSRRPHNVVVVAQANKMARTIWALLAKNRQFDPNYKSTAVATA
ncbi:MULTISPECIES: IS110 family transposase [Acidithiobacillus]|uniref:Transposase n=3 Tax=Acidithiobacillus TaxID=119977 RepID=A0A179BLE6_ACIFR|nr:MULTISPECIES: IS110 family transposase [Acidithiobacillus]MEB8486239.1 IS110 family transposase [Acidithiobacillus ferriphilus]MEB8491385.1 IS110 family transposase [Acidithiobacillus ferriphilus]MEB8491848.1 IS110 family transposase [Acidithiobacillus ferriphilus]MEB8512984.1 IS110 family transposase [Acidithiobacillus ferriphilus]MEB8521554.1 IS110 family transposase [Acidithiobacillus ferriphilus]